MAASAYDRAMEVHEQVKEVDKLISAAQAELEAKKTQIKLLMDQKTALEGDRRRLMKESRT